MAEFRMPSLGADMEAGTLVEWLKQPGDAVHRGDIVAVVETDKGAIEVEIFMDGTMGKKLVAARDLPAGLAAKARLLLDLTQRALLPRLARFELPLRQRPVVVAGPVDEQDAAVANDHPPARAHCRHQRPLHDCSSGD